MVYLFYNSINGSVIQAYGQSCYPRIPIPNISIQQDVWKRVINQNRYFHVDVKTKQFVIGDVKPVKNVKRLYSKLLIIRNLKRLQIWQQVKKYIQDNGYYDQWSACTYLSSQDQMFQNVLQALKTSFPDVNVQDFLKECYY